MRDVRNPRVHSGSIKNNLKPAAAGGAPSVRFDKAASQRPRKLVATERLTAAEVAGSATRCDDGGADDSDSGRRGAGCGNTVRRLRIWKGLRSIASRGVRSDELFGDNVPVFRGKQPRRFPAQGPSDAVVHFIWSSDPPPEIAAAVDRLASRTAYLGKACSPTRQDAHRLLPAARIQSLQDVLDHEPRCRGDG